MVGRDQEHGGERGVALHHPHAVVAEPPGARQQELGAEADEVVGQAIAEGRRKRERCRNAVRRQQPVECGEPCQQACAHGGDRIETGEDIRDDAAHVLAACGYDGRAGGRGVCGIVGRGLARRSGRAWGAGVQHALWNARRRVLERRVARLGSLQASVDGERERRRPLLRRGGDGGLDVLGAEATGGPGQRLPVAGERGARASQAQVGRGDQPGRERGRRQLRSHAPDTGAEQPIERGGQVEDVAVAERRQPARQASSDLYGEAPLVERGDGRPQRAGLVPGCRHQFLLGRLYDPCAESGRGPVDRVEVQLAHPTSRGDGLRRPPATCRRAAARRPDPVSAGHRAHREPAAARRRAGSSVKAGPPRPAGT